MKHFRERAMNEIITLASLHFILKFICNKKRFMRNLSSITFLSQKLFSSLSNIQVALRRVVSLNKTPVISVTIHSLNMFNTVRYLYTVLFKVGFNKVSYSDLCFVLKCAVFARLYFNEKPELCSNINSFLSSTGLFPGMGKVCMLIPTQRLVYIANISVIKLTVSKEIFDELTKDESLTISKLSNCVTSLLPHFTKSKLWMQDYNPDQAGIPFVFNLFFEQVQFNLHDANFKRHYSSFEEVDSDSELEPSFVNFNALKFNGIYLSSPAINLSSLGTIFSLIFLPTVESESVTDFQRVCCSQTEVQDYSVTDVKVDLDAALRAFFISVPTGPNDSSDSGTRNQSSSKKSKTKRTVDSKPVQGIESNETVPKSITSQITALSKVLMNIVDILGNSKNETLTNMSKDLRNKVQDIVNFINLETEQT